MTIVGFVNGVITARVLGPEGRGLFQLLVLLPTTLSNFGKLGIPQANVYFMRRRGASASDTATNSIWLAMLLGGVLAGVCWLGRHWLLTRVLKDATPEVLVPALMVIPFVLVQAFILGVAQAQQRFREYNIQQVVPNVLAFIGLTVTLLWLETGLIGAVLVQMGILVVVSVWLVVRVHRHSPLHLRPNIGLAREMVGFGGKSYLQTLAATLHLRLDQYMIGYLLDPASVGIYAIAVNFSNMLLKVPDATGTALFPRLAGATEAEAHAATAQVCRHTLFFTTVLALGVAVVTPFVIPIVYGDDFGGSIVPLLVLLPGVVLMSLYLILTRNFTSRGKQEINILAAALALVLNIGCNWVLIPRLGVTGAALAHLVSYGTAALVLLVWFVRESGHTVPDTVLLRRDELVNVILVGRRLVRIPARS